jgi:hypothetical protein
VETLEHDVAFAAALAILDVVKPRLPRAEWPLLFEDFYRTCLASLATYQSLKPPPLAAREPSLN